MPVYSKVKAGFIGGIIAAALIAGLNAAGIDVTPEMASLITVVIATILAWLKVEKVGTAR